MNRKEAPQVLPLEELTFNKASEFRINNSIKGYFINSTEQPIVKIELLYPAGYKSQPKALIANAVNQLIYEGSKGLSALEIANYFESKGAFLEQTTGGDNASLQLYCLEKHFEELFPKFLQIVNQALIPEEEWLNYKRLKEQKFTVNQEKVSFLARNRFSKELFGQGHPYNNSIQQDDFNKALRTDLVDFYEKHYQQAAFTVLLSGKISDETLKAVEKHSKGLEASLASKTAVFSNNQAKINETIFIEKQGAQQSAIRIGKKIPGKQHSDFPALFFCNTILGGFFGSRLMSNLREEKGYTYGVGSGIISLKDDAYWFVSTEVGAEVTKASIKEIEFEIKRLQNEPISEGELNLVKQYLQGSLMRSFDGPFAAMDRFKSLYELDLDYEYYDNLIAEFKQMDASKIQSITQEYFNFDEMLKIIAGRYT